VFGFTVSDVDPAYMVLMFTAANEPPGRGASRTEDPVAVMTADDGTWRYTVDEPSDDSWQRPGFDDSGWQVMRTAQERRPPDDPKRDLDQYRVRRLEQAGAVGLGVAPGTVKVWIRREFTLTPPAGGADS
jgi:hypothetical protein